MEQTKETTIQIRCERDLVEVLKQESGRKGMTVTTFIRDAIRDQVIR